MKNWRAAIKDLGQASARSSATTLRKAQVEFGLSIPDAFKEMGPNAPAELAKLYAEAGGKREGMERMGQLSRFVRYAVMVSINSAFLDVNENTWQGGLTLFGKAREIKERIESGELPVLPDKYVNKFRQFKNGKEIEAFFVTRKSVGQ